MRRLVCFAGLVCPFVWAQGPASKASSYPTQQVPKGKGHGFHADGRMWLWPIEAQELSAQERDGVFRRQLTGAVALTWSLDRGQADLEGVSGESRMDQSLISHGVRVRITFADGKTQDFPARVVLGLDRNWAWGATRIPDGMVVEAILPADERIARIQLIDQQGILAWDAEIKESFFARTSKRSQPEMDKDFQPTPAFRASLRSDHPGQGRIDARVEARRELQNAYIKAGIYPPYQIVLKDNSGAR